MAGLALALLATLVTWLSAGNPQVIARFRNFYGILRIQDQRDTRGIRRSLTHGRVTHGFQYLDAGRRRWPTSYFGPESGIGLAMRFHPRRRRRAAGDEGLRVGVIGLGVGTIAAYLQPQDSLRFYEINPRVAEVAGRFFSYLGEAPGPIDIVLGDARVQLERELVQGPGQGYDIFVVDAFSSGAIPTHLLTVECAELYERHLNPEGLLVFHISNQAVDLAPVVRGLAERFGKSAVLVETAPDDGRGISHSTWMIVAASTSFLNRSEVQAARKDAWPQPSAIVWTDDFASVWRVLKP
jgi:spermidine synthase